MTATLLWLTAHWPTRVRGRVEHTGETHVPIPPRRCPKPVALESVFQQEAEFNITAATLSGEGPECTCVKLQRDLLSCYLFVVTFFSLS